LGRRQHHADPIGPREAPQRLALVGDAVLRARHGDAAAGDRAEAVEHGDRVLALDGQDHDVGGPDCELARICDDREPVHGRIAVRPLDPQAIAGDRLAVRAAGDQRDVVAGLVQPRPDHAADRSGAVDDE